MSPASYQASSITYSKQLSSNYNINNPTPRVKTTTGHWIGQTQFCQWPINHRPLGSLLRPTKPVISQLTQYPERLNSVPPPPPTHFHYYMPQLSNWEQFTPAQLRRVLKLSLAVFKNTGLFLDPYSSFVYPLLKDVLFSPRYLSVEGEVKHWHVRLMAAATMAQLLKRSVI